MNADQEKAYNLLKTARGQIDGIIKMLEDERYCIDVSNQIMAASSILKKCNLMILRQHMNHCVKEAMMHDQGEEKVEELMKLLDKVIK
ncbi:metal-sensing transcriptional repressor [Vallitalea pronyensis]|uniref:Copper-sensing transcriptional repressor CsoR n=1 Tax=Vallitalea pronyensis TaxID=1348613 RepID=A0A8J8MK93_9FIRM|nr:metal-sensing transcriptional repressor [Vallitalea pronyensis]QUI23402.1 metal-sensing transcriptional repressor [Vallitalea pronyensis]